MVFKKKEKSNFKWNGEIYDESHVRSTSCRQKIYSRTGGYAGIKERSAKTNKIRWYGHGLRGDDDSVLRLPLALKRGKPVTSKRRRRQRRMVQRQRMHEIQRRGEMKRDELRKEFGESG